MRRLSLALALAAALTLVLATAASSRPAAGITPVVFTDPAGDSGTAADLTNVSVTNDAGGAYSLEVAFATPLVSTSVVDIYLDTDLNPATGDPQSLGAEYVVEDVEGDNSFGFYKWDGTQWNFVNTTTIHVTGSADLKGLKFDLGSADLGNSKGFNFFVESIDGDGSAGHIDDGPSGSGSWQYKLQSPLRLSFAGGHSFAVKAGGTWVVALVAGRSDTGGTLGPEGALACSATSGATKLALVSHGFVSVGSGKGSVATCAFKVPTKLKHKLLHATVKVSYQGQSVSHSFTTTAK
jgi:hypothetical protein